MGNSQIKTNEVLSNKMAVSTLDNKRDYHYSNKKLLSNYKKYKSKEAKTQLILDNLNLVRKIAKMYANKTLLDYEDLVQEGVVGLIKGIEKFDLEREVEFSTYAFYWIRQSIDRALSQKGYLIRIPCHIVQDINKLIRLEKEELREFGSIDVDVICYKMNITLSNYYKLKQYIDNYQQYTSLNRCIDSLNGDDEVIEFIPNDSRLYIWGIEEEFNTEETVEKKLLREDIEEVLATLLPREESIIRMRYGLDDGEFKSLEQVGKKFNVTRERIRQIEAKALRKMRHYSRAQKLKCYCS